MPFTIAILLTFFTALLVLVIQPAPPSTGIAPEVYSPLKLLYYWEAGFWELLEFSMQMVLILVLGHALALTKPVRNLIDSITKYCNSTGSAAAIVSFSAMAVAYLNWGLGLIFGAILARKVAERASAKGIHLTYPLIGASGYAGLMIWHGGLSGSAPLKVTEPDHFLIQQTGIIPPEETLFSLLNIVIVILILTVIPLALYFIGKKTISKKVEIKSTAFREKPALITGAEKLDHSKILGFTFGGLIVGFGIYKGMTAEGSTAFSFLTLNYVNFMLFGLGIFLHGNFSRFVAATEEAVGGAAGIIIQFPIYAGIMGIMKYSGLINTFADFFIGIATADTLPVFTFFSAALVNVFVPSGGGQWAVQGPIVVQSATNIGSSISKNIMALAYGDGLTNMIQPFWALPLLGITGLDAKDILPYTLIIMLLGIIIFLSCLMIF